MPSFVRSSSLPKWVFPFAMVAGIGATLVACGSDDNTVTLFQDAGSGSDATVVVPDAASSDGTGDDGGDDGGQVCDASTAAILTAVANSGYSTCALCLERACMEPLQACYMDCACTQEALSLFTCIGAGGPPMVCAEMLVSGSNESQILQFVGCSHICGSECTADSGVDAGPDSSAALDASADASDAADASDGHADGGDGSVAR